MKLKTLGRIAGALETGVGAYFAKYAITSIPKDYSLFCDVLSRDCPLEYKALAGSFLVVDALAIPVCGLIVTDGLSDVITGYHHYFGLKAWQKFTKSEDRKKDIDKTIEKWSKIIEKPISFSRKEE